MADKVKQSDIDKILKDNTDELSKLFKNIQKDAFGLFDGISTSTKRMTDGFKSSVREIEKLNTPAEKYLGYQKLQETIQGKINELKSKTGYLDAAALAFKGEELLLQEKIANEQITAIQRSLTLDDVAKKGAVDALKIKMIAAGAELDFLNTTDDLQNTIIEKLEKQSKIIDRISPKIEKQKDSWSSIKNIGSEFASQFPFLTMLLGKMWEQFSAIEDAAFAVRQNMGMLIGDVGEGGLYGIVQNVSNEFTRIGVTAEIVGKSINSISNTFGNLAFSTKDIVTNFSALESSLGISSDTSSKVLRSLMGISQSSAKSQVSMIGFAKAFSTAAGVPLTEVMKDLSTISESVRTTFRGSTLQLVKSTVEARKLGLTINEVGNVAEKLLNFTESINAEIEASVMLGRNISFQDARTLAYKGDILGATKNILDTIEQTTNLNKLDALQLKSISEATGLTVGQLQDSLQIRKDLKELQLSGNEDARKQVDIYNQLNGLGKYAAEMKGNEALENIKNINNLARQKQIQAELLGLLHQVTDVLMPIFKLVGYIAEGINWVNKNTGGWLGTLTIGLPIVIGLLWGTVAAFKALSISIVTGVFQSLTLVIPAFTTSLIGMSTALTASSEVIVPATLILIGLSLAVLAIGAGFYLAAKSIQITVNALNDLKSIDFGNILKLAGAIGVLSLAMSTTLIGGLFGGVGMTLMISELWLLKKVVDPLSSSMNILADSFAKFVNSLTDNNLLLGITTSKNGIQELREEIQKFKDEDLKVLDKLGNLRTGISTGTEVINKKESGYADLTNAIVTAIRTGMSNIQITVDSNGQIKRNFTTETRQVVRSGI